MSRAERCSDTEVLRQRFSLLVERLDFCINVEGSLERYRSHSQFSKAIWATEESLKVELAVLDLLNLVIIQLNRLRKQVSLSFVQHVLSHTVLFLDHDSESMQHILTNSSFPAKLFSGSAELEMRISVTFVVFELAFCFSYLVCIKPPSLAFPFVVYTFSIVCMFSCLPNADSVELFCISIAYYDCSIACIADKTTVHPAIDELSFVDMNIIDYHFDKAVPCPCVILLTSAFIHGAKIVFFFPPYFIETHCIVLCCHGCLCSG